MKRRVVITGLGAVTPIGNNIKDMWEGVKAGKNGIDKITLFDASQQKPYLVAEIKDLEIGDAIPPKEARRLDRTTILALVAAKEAYDDSKLAEADVDAYRFGTFIGSGIGGLETLYKESKKAVEKGADRLSPFFIPNTIINLVGGNVAIKFNAKGPSLPIVTACSSATNSIGEAFRYIRDGYLELAFAGGAEAPVNVLGVGGFANMRAISPNLDKNRASIPFDKERSGFVIGEGAGILIIEELEHAKKRNAKIYAEMIGYNSNCDAFHITQPDESAEGITKCMLAAMKDAEIEPEMIDFISPHGTSTYYNDRMESRGIRQAFGGHAYKISISGTKSMHGHSLGAVGGIESAITALALQEGVVPPTINYKEKDPECDLDYTPNKMKKRNIRYALKNSLGFGGHNASLVFKKWEE
ncbi:MAG: beta-ketoacyl-ACP synthase II [Candidatus Marinimicrobia bacterium]|nr:beta-ketoacyl-ACP synthase II [Candidatus Neomarinimicrobiota bacterium]